ncbi:(d)CMP kinase [Algiphilus sp.]|uniref:(d)CMP kinase n=1 Tax=Algiphilus sp. TaxID=1872431 RepID=UPI001CA7B654|nr:(d)CMP kinase [Algiphilus sp.]MBY8965097.1 (d)CMP kinase [Algiphilus acroporae]MCI5062989.1 (d)CMP kinase [Algiphilus sp.]MCI5104250.1 (d)CMP kinase [Algiphilus sp.]MCR9092237.1 (d)CMP kinase [Pseudomonadota bacterium]
MSGAIPHCTIDGPSGVGKGTAAKWLATRLGWHLLDSGAMYRVAGIAAEQAGVALEDPEAVAAVVHEMQVRFDGDSASDRIALNGQDITAAVREEGAGMLASRIAVFPEVRDALLDAQRAFLQRPGLVADGRDMGSVVFPDAPLKIFLDASAEERARRRCQQLRQAGMPAILADVLTDIRARDARDRGRKVAPLKAAKDAVVIDTTELPIDAVCERIFSHVQDSGLTAVAS